MKTVRFAAVCLALALFVTALVPFAAQPVAAKTLTTDAPTQSLMDAALGLPLLAPMTLASAPVITIAIESVPAGSEYACTLVTQKPKDWTKMGRRHIFDATWTVKNSGTKNWGQNSIDFKYVSGTKMHTYGDSYDLSKDVGAGKQITLIVDMTTPKTKGYYTEAWGLFRGSKSFCKLSVTVNVNK